jgi:hypothetical protein
LKILIYGHLIVTKSDNTIKSSFNATDGIKIQKSTDNGTTWTNQFYVNNGNLIITGNLVGGTIAIGSGNSIFKADTAGIYLGNTAFANAPFRVTPSGTLTVSNLYVGTTNILDQLNQLSYSINGATLTTGLTSGITTISGNIHMGAGSTISWDQVIPPTASQVGALPSGTYIPTVPSYITSTKITGTSIESCTITGNNIIGGTISSGTNINVTTDVTIGDYLYMNPVNFGGGIKWNNVADIYIDPPTKTLVVAGINVTQIGSYSGNTVIRGNVTFPDSSIGGVAVFG